MRIKKIVYAIVAYLPITVMGQTSLIVHYKYEVIPRTSPFHLQYDSKLTVFDHESIYEVFLLEKLGKRDTTLRVMTSTGSYRMYKPKSNSFYYKDSNSNLLLNKERISIKRFIVVDNLDIFDWEIHAETKSILGYTCQKATTHFRGYDYTVFFAPDIPVSNGPWKLHGLPGLILLAEKDNGSFRLAATSLEISNQPISISNPFEGQENISRQEYEDLYTKKYYEINNFMEEHDGVTITRSMPKGAIELIIKE